MSKRSRSPSGSDLEDDAPAVPCLPPAFFEQAAATGGQLDVQDLCVARMSGSEPDTPLDRILCAGMLPPSFWAGGVAYRENARLLKDLLMLPPFWAGAPFALEWPRMLEASWVELGMPADELQGQWPRWGATLLDFATHMQGTAAVGFNMLDGSDERYQPQWYSERCECFGATKATAEKLMPAWLAYKKDEDERRARGLDDVGKSVADVPPAADLCDGAADHHFLRAKGERVYKIARAVLADLACTPQLPAYSTAQGLRGTAWQQDWIPWIAAAAVTDYDNVLEIRLAEQTAAIAWLRDALQRVMVVFLMDPRTWPTDRTEAVTLGLMPAAIADLVRGKYRFKDDADKPLARMPCEAQCRLQDDLACRFAWDRDGARAPTQAAPAPADAAPEPLQAPWPAPLMTHDCNPDIEPSRRHSVIRNEPRLREMFI
jgi:hypothetical protein